MNIYIHTHTHKQKCDVTSRETVWIYSERYIWTEGSQTNEHILPIQVQKKSFFVSRKMCLDLKGSAAGSRYQHRARKTPDNTPTTNTIPTHQTEQRNQLFITVLFQNRENTTVE